MIISINEKQEVLAIYSGFGIEANNVTSFDVDSIPEKESGKVTCFDPETMTFYQKERESVDIEAIKEMQAKNAERREAQEKRAAALKWLADNDWKVNKYALGEWTKSDPRWLEYLTGRQTARSQIDEADYVLKMKYN